MDVARNRINPRLLISQARRANDGTAKEWSRFMVGPTRECRAFREGSFMATTMPSRLPFGSHLLPALRAAQARRLSVVDAQGESRPAQVPPPVLHRHRLRPLRFRLV